MDLHLRLPEEVVEALGPEPEREALEGVLLLLVREGRVTVERAGEVLGLGDSEEAERWYEERTLTHPGLVEGSGVDEVAPVFVENLEGGSKRPRRSFRITPDEKGSGFSDVSINHDKYLHGDAR